MNSEEDKNKTLSAAEADVEFKQSVDGLTDVILEDLKQDYHNDLEPFDAYAQRIRAQVHENMEDFRNRFLEGYEVLLQEIMSHQSKKDVTEEKPPPGTIIL